MSSAAAALAPQFNGSTPSVSQFDPRVIPYQFQVIKDVRSNFDYSLGAHEILLSGSVGSAKSILMAHLGITHCLLNEKARFCLGRQSMPDLKETILATVLEHLEGDLEEDTDYEFNKTKSKITFSNGSEIVSRSWADKKFKRFRSVSLSAAAVEELTENDDTFKGFYDELFPRVKRLPHVRENFIVSATNPDSPQHWAYKRFFIEKKATRHVYKSRTVDNPFLGPEYVRMLRENFDPKMALRMIEGEWIEIDQERIYHAYERDQNFRDTEYVIDKTLPLRLAFDFNIGLGKPMSAVAFQYDPLKDEAHFFEDFVVHGADTADLLDEIAARGFLDLDIEIKIHGDATGKNRSTKSKQSDYDIIEQYLASCRRKDVDGTPIPIRFEIDVPRSNPPVRERHNLVNAYMKNSLGRVRLYVYSKAAVLDEGFRLTQLKKGGQYIEDDSKHYQHVTTAAGYGLDWAVDQVRRRSTSSTR